MKLTVTKKELLVLCSKALGQEVNEIVISKEPNLDFRNKIVNQFRDAGFLGEHEEIMPHCKISAIKLIRDIYPSSETEKIGLAQAKYVVEHWAEFVLFLSNNRRLPVVTYDWHTGIGKFS